jgi:hypothetical protein
MDYEESYLGVPILLTTTEVRPGGWTSEAALLETGRRVNVAAASEVVYESEDEARRAARSAAAGAIDRARASRGKP